MTYHAATTTKTRNLAAAATMAVLMAVAGTSRAAVGPMAAAEPKTLAAQPKMLAAESKMLAGKSSYADGYARTGSSRGDKGYAEDDVYGDKDGDGYGFGAQTSFGQGDKGAGGVGAYHESAAYDDRDKPTFSAWHYEDKDGRPTKRYVFDSSRADGGNKKHRGGGDQPSAEASEYDSVEAYDDDADDGGGNTHAGYETEEADPEYGALYDSADAYNDADAYY